MAKHLIPSDRSIQVMKTCVKRLNDGGGLHIRQSAGSKHWYQDFSVNGQRISLRLGSNPEIGLAEARRRSEEMRSEVKDTKENRHTGEAHMVPLSWQSIEILKQLDVITGRTTRVFAGQGWENPVISESAINKAIQDMEYSTQDDQTTQGIRATARTKLVERMGWHKDIAELQLDHKIPDANGRAYSCVQFNQSRREMMQAWSDYLAQLESGVIPEIARHHSQPAEPNFGINTNFTVPFIEGKSRSVRHGYGATNVMKITWTLPSALPPMDTK